MVATMDVELAPWPMQVLHDWLAYLGRMIILGGFGVQQVKVDAL